MPCSPRTWAYGGGSRSLGPESWSFALVDPDNRRPVDFGRLASQLEALRARGVSVSFAGSPDRIEARLVPEAGFPFDPFRVSGLPRRPGLVSLVIDDLPRSGPFKLDQGRRAGVGGG